jgi:hypothetical protein
MDAAIMAVDDTEAVGVVIPRRTIFFSCAFFKPLGKYV